MDEKTQRHPCVVVFCTNMVAFDDEPYCFTHSDDSGSYVSGYSYRASQQRKEEMHKQRAEAAARPWGKAF